MNYKEIEFEIERRDNLIDSLKEESRRMYCQIQSLKEENKKLKDALHGSFIGLDWDTLSKVADSGGMRCGELVNIGWGKK